MKSTHTSSKWGGRLAATLVVLFVLATSGSFSAWVAHAEGSRDLYPSGITGYRANIEWRTSFYGPNFLRRRTLLQVYADPGEVILLGSSAVGVDLGNIQIYTSDEVTGRIGDETVAGPAVFDCEAQRTGPTDPRGRITSRAEELAGPDTVPGGGVPGGYVPCYYEVPPAGSGSSDNIYWVVFLGPSGPNADIDGQPTTGEIDLTSAANFDASQTTTIAAWDVTVRSDLTSTQDINGRLFADYLSMITGDSGRPMYSDLYVLTTDSYRYQVGLRGLDPYGFIVYSNNRGFLNTDGTALFHDVLADPTLTVQEQNQLNALVGNVSLAEPTHHIFFNEPSSEAISALNNGLVNPITPQINSFVFDGSLTGNTSLVGQGGTFNIDINVPGSFLLVISRDGVNFDPTNSANRVLIGVGSTGTQQVVWDGLANDGTDFPPGSYSARIVLRAGEVHFPLLDVENSLEGGPQYQLLNPPDGCPPATVFAAGCFTGFYDDQGYTTASGVDVGTPGVELPGNNPPPQPFSNPLTGFDTTGTDRAFGNGTQAGWGDKKGLDLWSFYPTEADTPLQIIALDADLSITKAPSRVQFQPGNTVQYTVVVHNAGPAAAENAVVTDTLPAELTFVSTSGCTNDPNGVPTCSLGTIAADTSVTYTIQATVNSGVTGQIPNTVEVGSDTPDSDPTNNTAQAQIEVVTELPLCDLSITKVPSQAQFQPGNTVQYTLQVNNAGPDPAENVVVADSLPAQLTFVSTSGCDNDPGGVPTCSLGTIAAGASKTYTIRATVNSGVTGVVPNTASVSTDTPESNSNNNTAQAQIEVVPVQSPTPTPTRKKHEKEEEPATPTPVPPPPPAPTPLPPAPPVVLLPETGVAPVGTAPAWPFVIFPALGLLVGWAIYRGRNR